MPELIFVSALCIAVGVIRRFPCLVYYQDSRELGTSKGLAVTRQVFSPTKVERKSDKVATDIPRLELDRTSIHWCRTHLISVE